jgi:S-formylglutathione hydrolase FrmB
MAVLKFNFLSQTLGMQTNVTVVLPSFTFGDFFNKEKEVYVKGMKFQTMYLLHGASGDDSDYVNFSNIVRFAEDNKLAVIMPPAFNNFYTDVPKGPKYWKFVSEEVPKVCQTFFPLSDKREDNFVAGLSMGAHGAMKMGIKCPEKFAAVLCMSGASFEPQALRRPEGPADLGLPMPDINAIMGDAESFRGSENDVYFYAESNVKEGRQLPKFFFSCGDKDFALSGLIKAKDFISALGYDVFYEEVPGYGHEWDFWDLTLRKAINNWLPLRHDVIYPEK